ncbi:MAG: hypothetical protein JOZ42_00360, partial [Acetobacteraceae bacterium]|nr:hypothetical protein [Acetobacteraceae bacterium]
EQIGDIDGIAHAKFSSARIRLRRPNPEPAEIETILSELEESFRLAKELGRTDAIASIAPMLGEMLIKLGFLERALPVLSVGHEAAERLGWQEQLEQIRSLRAEINGAESRPDEAARDPGQPEYPQRSPFAIDGAIGETRSLVGLPGDPTVDPPRPKPKPTTPSR